LFTTHRIPARGRRHALDEYVEFLEHLGVDPRPIDWGLRLTEEERSEQRAFLVGLGRPVCGVVVGTSRPAKNWPAERYARLLEALESEHGFRCVLLGGPSAAERAAADSILARTNARPVDALGPGVRRLAWLLDGCDLVVSPDTGPLHVACALGVPAVGLFGYTDPRRYGPHPRYAELVVDGYGSLDRGRYGRARRPGGMRRVTLDAVLEKVGIAVQRYVAVRAGARAGGPGRRGGQ
jgi:heptosyltransferase I